MHIYTRLGIFWLFVLGCVSPVTGQGRFSLSLNLAPVYTHSSTREVLPLPDQITQLPTSDARLKSHGLNVSVGLTARYALSAHWSASAGILANHTVSSRTDLTLNGVNSIIYYQYNHPFTLTYKTPLLINYQVSTNRLSPYFSAGVTLDFRGISYVDLGNGQEIPVKFGKKSVVVTPMLGAGIIYRFTDHYSLVAQPTIQYNVESHPNYDYYHWYQLGFQTQLMYKF